MHTPYPYERLLKLTRAQTCALSEVRALFADTRTRAALRCAGELLGETVECELSAPVPCARAERIARASRPAVWVLFESADGAAWLELPLGVGEHVADRALGGESAFGLLPVAAELDELSLGAIAYVLARMAAAADSRFRLRSIGVAPQPSEADDAVLRWPITLRVDDARATLQLYAPSRVFRALPARAATRGRLSALTLTLWAEAGSARLRADTLRSLVAEDVVILDRVSLTRGVDSKFRGTASVRVEGSASALVCRVEGERLEVESIACTSERSMTSGRRLPESTTEPSAEPLARDVPLDIGLEIARFRLTLGELERVQPGDVLTTGRRIGEYVTLRAAGLPVAEGELVDVEGEIGVRITRLLG